jgi:diguanylate cyclase (GGDEF)-like protein
VLLVGPVTARLRRGLAVLHRDPLTGLPMRPYLMRLLRHDLGSSRSDPLVGLLYIDLDSFKRVNDSAGHDVGDEVLALAAERITAAGGADAVVARLSGDEFAVLLRACDSVDQVRAIAQRISRALAAPLPEHLAVAGLTVAGMASVGTAVRMPDDDARRQPGVGEDMLREADLAMLAAKRRGGGHVEHYRPGLAVRARHSAARHDEMTHALQARAFDLQFQPVVDAADGAIVRVEALLRLRSPDGDTEPPGELLAAAEATGRLHEVTDWVLAHALAACARWWVGGQHVPVAVNVSADEIAQPSGAGELLSAVRRTEVPTTALVVDVHRGTGAAPDAQSVADAVRTLREAGVGVVLEDIDRGWPLADVVAIRADTVSISRATVASLLLDVAGVSLAAALVSAAAGVGSRVTAKGVETEAEVQAVCGVGCTELQGDRLAPVTDVAQIEWRTSHLTMRDAGAQQLTGPAPVGTVQTCTPASSYADRAIAENQQSRDPSSPSGPGGFSRPSGHYDAAEES